MKNIQIHSLHVFEVLCTVRGHFRRRNRDILLLMSMDAKMLPLADPASNHIASYPQSQQLVIEINVQSPAL
jgi:hypothetical protein